MKVFLITLLCLCIIAVTGTGVYFYLSNQRSETSKQGGAEEAANQMNNEGKASKTANSTEKGGRNIAEAKNLSKEAKDFLITFQYRDYDTDVAYKDEAKVKEIIRKQHNYLNDLAGWGHLDSVDLRSLAESPEWQQLKEDISYLKKDGFSDSEVLNDLSNAEAFFVIGQEGDSMSIRYLHRIFHDLDAEINGIEVDKIWGVTRSFGDERKNEVLFNYIKG
ncbi:hypothetical protein ABES25_12080 [Bacillus gobiensis]|uniref:hypothetical protein n=1 Tax=Bacillus gobiensis TaxID=1441095 RepID=UPI003D1CA183